MANSEYDRAVTTAANANLSGTLCSLDPTTILMEERAIVFEIFQNHPGQSFEKIAQDIAARRASFLRERAEILNLS